MDISDLKIYGEALFGEKWQSQLSKKLGINRVVVQNWIKGRTKIPSYLNEELFQLLTEKSFFVNQALNRLDNYKAALKKAITKFKRDELVGVKKGTVVYLKLELDKDTDRKSYRATIQLSKPIKDINQWESYIFGNQGESLIPEIINFEENVKNILTREKALLV